MCTDLPVNALSPAARALCFVGAFVVVAMSIYVWGPLAADPQDFRAFYCAGSAVIAGRDPYRAEPLRACEDAAIRSTGFTPLAHLVVPAPLPGYALEALGIFARLPFRAASAAFDALLIVSLAVSALLLRAMTGFKLPVVIAAIAVSGGWVSLENGQLAPFVLAALCASAFALARNRPRAAAFFAAGTLLEPHLGLPVCLCLAATVPRTRAILGGAGAGLALLSIGGLGWPANLEYFTRVLPAHALAESAAIGQFSLTSLLTHFGIEPRLALRAGDLSYIVTTILGCWTARRLFSRTGAAELLVAVPAGVVLAGGPFIHLSQMVVAVPALMLLLRYVPERRNALALALIFIAVPWQELFENGALVACIASGAIGWTIGAAVFERTRSAGVAGVVTLAVAAAEAAMRAAFPPPHGNPVAAMLALSGNNVPADVTWSIYEHITQSSGTPWYLASHLPTWTALAVLLLTAVAAACPPRSIPSEQRAVELSTSRA